MTLFDYVRGHVSHSIKLNLFTNKFWPMRPSFIEIG